MQPFFSTQIFPISERFFYYWKCQTSFSSFISKHMLRPNVCRISVKHLSRNHFYSSSHTGCTLCIRKMFYVTSFCIVYNTIKCTVIESWTHIMLSYIFCNWKKLNKRHYGRCGHYDLFTLVFFLLYFVRCCWLYGTPLLII